MLHHWPHVPQRSFRQPPLSPRPFRASRCPWRPVCAWEAGSCLCLPNVRFSLVSRHPKAAAAAAAVLYVRARPSCSSQCCVALSAASLRRVRAGGCSRHLCRAKGPSGRVQSQMLHLATAALLLLVGGASAVPSSGGRRLLQTSPPPAFPPTPPFPPSTAGGVPCSNATNFTGTGPRFITGRYFDVLTLPTSCSSGVCRFGASRRSARSRAATSHALRRRPILH